MVNFLRKKLRNRLETTNQGPRVGRRLSWAAGLGLMCAVLKMSLVVPAPEPMQGDVVPSSR